MTKPAGAMPHVSFDTRSEEPGGIDCPKCGARIRLTINALLVERQFRCPNSDCGGVLTLDASRSQDALTMLERFRTAAKPI